MSAPATLGLIGDVHAEDRRLHVCLQTLHDAGAERLLAVGDIVDGHGDADRCCRLLIEHGALCVRGNHDRWLLESRMRDLPRSTPLWTLSETSLEFLRHLPATRSIETAAGGLLLGHGTAEADMAGLAPDDGGYALACNDALTRVLEAGKHCLLVGGHTHRRMLRQVDTLLALNPGALCDANIPGADPPGFALLELARHQLCFYEIAGDGAVRLAETLPLPL